MGNEADDSQTMVRLLVHNNRFDVVGLIAVSSCHQYAGKNDANPIRNNVQPTMILDRIEAYAKVLPNLQKHASGWATAEVAGGDGERLADVLARMKRNLGGEQG